MDISTDLILFGIIQVLMLIVLINGHIKIFSFIGIIESSNIICFKERTYQHSLFLK